MTTFAEAFWGVKNNGFFVLYHNMKHGQISSKELVDFLRDRTFAPFWNILRTLAEKLASLHMQLVHTWSDLMKDIIRYGEDQHKRHKSLKESESGTLEIVQAIQTTTTALHKAKEIYHTRCLELERLKRENASPKDVEKSEARYKKAKEDYKSLLDKYAIIREDFQTKMAGSCTHFQELEEEHICQMKDFIDTYARALQNEHILFGQAQEEFRSSSDTLSVKKLLATFIEAKSTGQDKPGPLEFVEPDLSSLPATVRPTSPELVNAEKKESAIDKSNRPDSAVSTDSSGSVNPIPPDQPGPLSRSVNLRVSRTWFLKKKKDKKKKKKDDNKDSESVDTQGSNEVQQNPEVDEEGYTIRPSNTETNGEFKTWYSSDSDSNSDTDIAKKLKVQIRPLTNNPEPSDNVDDIRQSVVKLRLSPTIGATKKGRSTPVDKKSMKRSQSESDTLNCAFSKPNLDLLNLDFFTSTPVSGSSTGYPQPSSHSLMYDVVTFNSGIGTITAPTQSNVGTSVTDVAGKLLIQTMHSTRPEYLVTGDLFNQISQAVSSGCEQSTVSSNRTMLIENGLIPPPLPQRPPSRGNVPMLPQIPARPGRTSPYTVNRDSVTWNTPTPFGSSRGPSPLTINMVDSVPLAVAFTETINAYFRGTDATKCSVKMTGNLTMSFPAGVVQVFTGNSNPTPLNFRIKNFSRLEKVLLNKKLVTEDSSQSVNGMPMYSFDMTALCDHLHIQGENNKYASYFNIDILKYQIKASPGVESTPLPVVVYWKCDNKCTDYRLDYRFNAAAMSSITTLKNITATVIVDGGVENMQSLPEGSWNNESKRATWKLNDISEVSENCTQGSIRAKFTLNNGKSTPSSTALQFVAEGATLSGVEFELVGSGYKISLSKKRFGAGKYIADPDKQ